MEELQIEHWAGGGVGPGQTLDGYKNDFIANCLQMGDFHLALKYRHYADTSEAISYSMAGQFTPAVLETRAGVSFMCGSLPQCPQNGRSDSQPAIATGDPPLSAARAPHTPPHGA